MAWVQVKIQISSSTAEKISAALTELGALAVTYQDAGDQPLYEPSPDSTTLWDDVIVTGLFEKAEQDSKFQKICADLKEKFPALQPQISELEDQDWERIWMQDFKPMKFGQRLSIIPSFESTSPSPHEVVLDPGLAFGTGTHPTTALCLRWLDENITDNEVLIDYGCGSGILGIAALKLGAKKVFAIDNDPQALIATNDNAKQNGLSEQQIISLLPSELPEKTTADVLVANILANPLIELAPLFATLLRPKGKIVLSGILEEQTESVIQVYKRWFKILSIANEEGWTRIEGIISSGSPHSDHDDVDLFLAWL